MCCSPPLRTAPFQALEDGYLNITGIAADVGVDDDDEDYETVLKTSDNTNNNNNSTTTTTTTNHTGGDGGGGNDYDEYAHYERMQGKPGGTAGAAPDDAGRPYNAVPAGTAMTYDAADAVDATRPYSDVKEGSKEYVPQQGDLDAYIATEGVGVPTSQAQDRKCKYANAQGRKCFNGCTSPNFYCKNHTCSAAGCPKVTCRLRSVLSEGGSGGSLGSRGCCSFSRPRRLWRRLLEVWPIAANAAQPSALATHLTPPSDCASRRARLAGQAVEPAFLRPAHARGTAGQPVQV